MATEFGSLSLRSDSNLQGYYKLENVNDELGAHNLTNNNSVTFATAKFNNGADQGTSNSNKYLGTTNRLNITGGACSFSFWAKIRTEVGGSGAYILFQQNDKTTNFVRHDFYYYDNGGTKSLRFDRVKINSASDSTTIYPVTLGTSNFNHFCVTYNGTNMIVYLNGSSVASGTSTGNGASGTQTDGFYIGADNTGSQIASALFDDFAIFNRALTPGEVSLIYSGGTTGAAFLTNFI